MISSKQQTHFWYLPTVSIINPVSGMIKTCMREFAYLCCPEDTTDYIGHSQAEITCSKVIGPRQVLKGVFWVIVSIAVSVVVGQVL